MSISQLLHSGRVTVSLELFPPKPGSTMDVGAMLRDIAALSPDFVSVTYGAGGSTAKNTLDIARSLQNDHGVPALAHLTGVCATREGIERQVADLQAAGIHNILALRGDLPQEGTRTKDYPYAADLISHLRSLPGGDKLTIGAACYPEGHVECPLREKDIDFLKRKVDCGVDFLTTQMFFENDTLYQFLYRVLTHNISVPVVAGIMPVTNVKQIRRSCELSGCTLPRRLAAMADRFGDDPPAMKQAGIAYATEQIVDLLSNGVEHIHIYTMNKPDVAAQIMANLSDILRPHEAP